MGDVLLRLLNMSISAGWLVLAVLVIRALLHKAPRRLLCLLWALVGVRLCLPFSIESVLSALSLLPRAATAPRQSAAAAAPSAVPQVGVPVAGAPAVIPPGGSDYVRSAAPSVRSGVDAMTVLGIVWAVGAVLLLAWAAVSYIRLRRTVGAAVRLRDELWQSESVASPFVLGVFRPRIYLPFTLSEAELGYVVAHERAHIRRRDQLIKPLGWLLLSLHWFNPLIWAAYFLLCRDIELACDERVIAGLSGGERADYSQALLSCSATRRLTAACPLAFGEVGVKERVRSVLNYKKPAFWMIVAVAMAAVILAVCFLTDPVSGRMPYKMDADDYSSGLISYQSEAGKRTEQPLDSGELSKLAALFNEGTDVRRLGSDETFDERAFLQLNGRDDSCMTVYLGPVNTVYFSKDAGERYSAENPALAEYIRSLGWRGDAQGLTVSEGDIATSVTVVSGEREVPTVAFPPGTPLSEIKERVFWLPITFDPSRWEPFDVLCGDSTVYGSYRLYDAQTLEEIDFFHPSGLSQQTYIFHDVPPGSECIVILFSDIEGEERQYCFGARIPLPELSVFQPSDFGEPSIQTLLCGYSWHTVNADGTSTSTCSADASEPLSESIPTLKLQPATLGSIHPLQITLAFDALPDSVSVTALDPNDPLSEGEAVAAEFYENGFSFYHTSLHENRVYRVTAQWENSGNGSPRYFGSAEYVFAVDVLELGNE